LRTDEEAASGKKKGRGDKQRKTDIETTKTN